MTEKIHVRARKFLQEFFNDEELTTFCFDYFPQVYNDFAQGMAKNQKVLMLVSYSQRLERFDELLAALQRERPKGYKDYFAEKPRPIAPEPQSPEAIERNPRQIFISHAHQDAKFAQRLAADLQANGWQTWMAQDNIRPGEKWVEAINRGLTESGVFALLLTPEAVASRWVQSEMNVAIGMEHRGELRLVPLNVKSTISVPALWGAYQWIPFNNHYEAGLEALLGELDPQKKPQILPRIMVHEKKEQSRPTVEMGDLSVGKTKKQHSPISTNRRGALQPIIEQIMKMPTRLWVGGGGVIFLFILVWVFWPTFNIGSETQQISTVEPTIAAVETLPSGEEMEEEATDSGTQQTSTVEPITIAVETLSPSEEMEEESTDEVVTIEFWHAMGGELGGVVDELVARFNDSQDGIVVNATFQGSYDDTYNALLASFETDTAPNIVQNFDLTSQLMIDSGRLIPVYQLMEADDYDDSVFVPAVRDYYSDENGMVAMVFNGNTPILYYNKTMFEEAGVAPPPEGESWSFSEMLAACDVIQESGVANYCIALGQVGWYFEQILANSGGLYFNNNNGRTDRATEVVFNQGTGVEVFEFLTGLVANGYSPNLGNTWTDTDTVFFAGEAAMLFDSTSGALGIQGGSEFEVDTMFIPYADSARDRNGVFTSGAALWLIDAKDDAQNAAAWGFLKFIAEEDQQVTWHTSTGYFPVRTDISSNVNLTVFWEEYPNFATVTAQLETTKTTLDDGSPNYAVLGGRAGPAPSMRRFIAEAYSAVFDNGMTAQEALDIAAEKANQELADYNAFFE